MLIKKEIIDLIMQMVGNKIEFYFSPLFPKSSSKSVKSSDGKYLKIKRLKILLFQVQ